MADNKTGKAIKIVVRDGKVTAYCSGTPDEPQDIVHQWKEGPVTFTKAQADDTNNNTQKAIRAAWGAYCSEGVRKMINTGVDALTTAVQSINELQLTQSEGDAILARIDAAKKQIKKRIVKAGKPARKSIQPAAADLIPDSVPETVPDSVTIIHEPDNVPETIPDSVTIIHEQKT